MNETARQALQAELERAEAERTRRHAELQKTFERYEAQSSEFASLQQRIDDLRDELGLGLEDRITVTPPELEAVA